MYAKKGESTINKQCGYGAVGASGSLMDFTAVYKISLLEILGDLELMILKTPRTGPW